MTPSQAERDVEKALTDTESKADRDAKQEAGIATTKENVKLQHSDDSGGATTRANPLDEGPPMLQGDPSEPQGPEDAFGPGPKRGDYANRTGGVDSFESVPTADGGEPILGPDGEIIDYKPNAKLVPQVPRAANQGEVAGVKGGVDTTDED